MVDYFYMDFYTRAVFQSVVVFPGTEFDGVVGVVHLGHVAVPLHVPGGHVVGPERPVRQPPPQLLGPVAVVQVEPALEQDEIFVPELLQRLQRGDRALPPVAAADDYLGVVLVRERGDDGLLEPAVAGLVGEHLPASLAVEAVPRGFYNRNGSNLVRTRHHDRLEHPADRPRGRVREIAEELNLVLVPDVQHVVPVVPEDAGLLHVSDALRPGGEHFQDALVEERVAVLWHHSDAFGLGQRASGDRAAAKGTRARRGAGIRARGGQQAAHLEWRSDV